MPASAEVPLHRLDQGARFGLLLETTGKILKGTVIYVTAGSVLVEWDAAPRTVRVTDPETGVEREFSASVKKREHISLDTPVLEV